METQLTLNNTCMVRELLIFLFSRNFILEARVRLGCYIVKTTENVASNNASYGR